MSDTEKFLLEQLAKPGFHGGDQLGKALGISRVSVSKHMASLRDKGLPLVSVAGKGYCLEDSITLLSEEKIEAFIAEKNRSNIADIQVHQELDSTNKWLLEQDFHTNKAVVCVTESQPAGRGRRDRQWHTSPYRNLMFSLSWRFANWPPALPGISLVAGLIVAEALALCGVPGVQIKWPNDIYLKNKKLGGLLVSAKGEASGACDLVVGVGVNHHILDSDAAAIDQDWIDLKSENLAVDRNQLAALISEGFLDLLPEFEQNGFESFQKAWNDRCQYMDQRVRLFDQTNKNDSALQGICRGVDKAAVLQIETESGKFTQITNADLSMRPV